MRRVCCIVCIIPSTAGIPNLVPLHFLPKHSNASVLNASPSQPPTLKDMYEVAPITGLASFDALGLPGVLGSLGLASLASLLGELLPQRSDILAPLVLLHKQVL